MRLKRGEIEIQKMNIQQMLDGGYTQLQISRALGISEGTVANRKKEIAQSATAGVVMSGGVQHTISGSIDVVAQMKGINDYCWKVLNDALDDDAKMDAAKEIRAQLKLHVEIYEKIYHAENVQRFQQGVLEALQDADPKLRDEAVANINRLREMAGVSLMKDDL